MAGSPRTISAPITMTGNRGRATLPCYRSEPLDTAVEFVGHAVLRLHLAASEPDAALHVYLSEEEPDGTVRYVTEGYYARCTGSCRPARRIIGQAGHTTAVIAATPLRSSLVRRKRS
jgi:predicted acyl esterase